MVLNCPACGKLNRGDSVFFFNSSRKHNESWTRCSECSSYYLNEDFNEQAEIFTNFSICNSEEAGVMMNCYKSKLFHSILSIAEKVAPAKKNWLDIGCSYGGLLLHARQRGFTGLHGTDIIREALDYCKTHGINTHQCFSLKEIEQSIPSFDVISAIDSNMFWTNQPVELSVIHNRLNADGIFIAKIVDRSWLLKFTLWLPGISKTSLGKKLISKSIFNHRFSMPLRSFIKTLEGSGFDILKISVGDALTSRQAGAILKTWYFLSDLVYRFTSINISPSVLVTARKKQ